jgi:exo-1,4-beta-D-glucosaminidase
MFEAVNHRMWDSTSGFTQWKINSCEPSVQWQIFDWYHKPMVSWYYTKKACEPLHVQLNLPDNKVSLINRRLAPAQDLRITARAFSLRGVLLGEKASRTNAPANGYLEVFPFPEPPGATPVYFVRLEIRNHGNEVVSDNFYWLRSQGTPDFSALESLPLVALEKKFRLSSEGGQRTARVTVKNPSPAVAFFVQLALTRGTRGEEILPVLWDDNYFTLLPGETREIAARFAEEDLAGAVPSVEVGGWNVETDYRCRSVNFSPPGFKAGQHVTMTVDIGDTFLDGSLVEVRINGKVVGTQRAWARGNRTQRLAFPGVRFDRAGKHIVTAGKLGVNILLDGPR